MSVPLVSGLPTGANPAAANDEPAPTTTTTAPAVAVPTAPATPTAAWEEAHASKAPASRARVRGPELGLPGVLTFTGGESAASADGGVSSSTVHLGRLVLGGAGGAPEVALSDGAQSLTPQAFAHLVEQVDAVASALRRTAGVA